MRASRGGGVVLVTLAALALVATARVAPPQASMALLFDSQAVDAALTSRAIFSGERVTTAFDVGDSSSGTEVDTSSSFAFASDGRTTATSTWAATFAADRYLEFELGAPLPAGLAVSTTAFRLRFASTGAVAVACHYFEVRRISTGTVLATHGSAVLPVACATGTTFSSSTTAIPSVGSSDLANDLRIRVFGSDSGGNGMLIDRATVDGQTAYASFELYPVMFRDAADSTPAEVPWELAGQ